LAPPPDELAVDFDTDDEPDDEEEDDEDEVEDVDDDEEDESLAAGVAVSGFFVVDSVSLDFSPPFSGRESLR